MPDVGDVFASLVDQHRNRGLGSGATDQVIRQIREDAWNGRGPGEYVVPGVRSIVVSRNPGSLSSLLVNGREVGQLHGGCDMMAMGMQPMLPGDLKLEGHYGNTLFYIDSVDVVEHQAPRAPSADTLDAQQCEDMAQQLLTRAQALRAAHPPAAVEHGEGTVRLGGVSVPVRKA